jgi:hypothetical protein
VPLAPFGHPPLLDPSPPPPRAPPRAPPCPSGLPVPSASAPYFPQSTHRRHAPQVMSKLVFLADTNIVSFIATTTTWMLFAIVWVVALGGFLAVPTHGFVTCLMPLTVVCIVVPPIYPAFYTAAVRLYFEANAALRLGEGAVDAREVGKGVDLDIDDDAGEDDGGGMD